MRKPKAIILSVLCVLIALVAATTVKRTDLSDNDGKATLGIRPATGTVSRSETPSQPLRDELAFKAFQELVREFAK